MSNSVVIERGEGTTPENDGTARLTSPFEAKPVLRVRDLTGEMTAGMLALTPHEETGSSALASGTGRTFVVVTPALRGGRLTLNWYDYGVLALVLASLASGIICLLRGV